MASDDALIQEINEQFRYAADEWRENYEAGDEDMRYVAGDPWDPKEREARKKANRPCLHLDELSQYLSQRCNDVRMNKRAVKIDPEGAGADDKTADLRSDIVRTIEIEGGIGAYITGYENAIQRGFGFWRVDKRYVEEDSFDQELVIVPIPNPNTVYIDPDAREQACRDMRFAIVFEEIRKAEFKRKWPKAKQIDFTTDASIYRSTWVKETTIQVAEYWKVEEKPARLILFGPDERMSIKAFDDELPDGAKIVGDQVITPAGPVPILRDRKVLRREIVQYVTNGLEILERNEWEGAWIPIIPCWGRMYWYNTDTGTKRIVESLIRKVRDAQMMHNYCQTAIMEAIGQVMKAPYLGYRGQFDGLEQFWNLANRAPMPYLEINAVTEATGTQILPLPTRNYNEPQIQSYQMADESAKRSIQNGLGMYNASVGRHDTKATSGIAIKELDAQSDQGNFHFIDNFDIAIRQTGVILDDLIPHIYDTARDMLLRKPDETTKQIKINQPIEEDGQAVEYRTDTGKHKVSISTGPSYQSQREMAQDFVDLLIQNLGALPIDPAMKTKILSLSINLKQLGPIGDEMSDILDPKQENQDPAAAQKQAQQAQQMIQALTEQLNQAKEALSTRATEQQGKVQLAQAESKSKADLAQMEIASREKIAAMNAEVALQTAAMKNQLAIDIEKMKAHMTDLELAINSMMTQRQMQHDHSMEVARIGHEVNQAGRDAEIRQQEMDLQREQQQEAQRQAVMNATPELESEV